MSIHLTADNILPVVGTLGAVFLTQLFISKQAKRKDALDAAKAVQDVKVTLDEIVSKRIELLLQDHDAQVKDLKEQISIKQMEIDRLNRRLEDAEETRRLAQLFADVARTLNDDLKVDNEALKAKLAEWEAQ